MSYLLREGLQDLQGNGGAGFGICKGVVVAREVEAAAGGNGLQLMVGQFLAEHAAGSPAGTMENIIGIVHAVGPEDRLQAVFIERAVVGNQRQAFDQGRSLLPYMGKYRSLCRILHGQAVDTGIPVTVVFRLWTDEAVKTLRHFTSAYYDDAYAAYARRLPVGRLEIYGCKIPHAYAVRMNGKNSENAPNTPTYGNLNLT